jgi:hypothetical protein
MINKGKIKYILVEENEEEGYGSTWTSPEPMFHPRELDCKALHIAYFELLDPMELNLLLGTE